MKATFIVALTLAALTISCTGRQTEAAPTSSPSSGALTPSPEAAPSAEPVTDYSSFTHALETAGFRVRPGKSTEADPLFRPGQRVFIDGVEVSTYEYPSAKALGEWRSLVSPDGYSIPTRTGGTAIVEWTPPHFYASGTLVVLYFGDKPHTLKALDLLLGHQFAGG